MNTAQDANRFDDVINQSLVQAAKDLRDGLLTRTAKTDEIRQLPEETLADLEKAGLLTALVPKKLGGSEVSFHTFFDIVQELGKVDGSVAWTYAVLGFGSWMVSTFFSEAVGREVFESKNPLTSAVMAPSKIVARRVDGGIQVSEGQWSFNSGIHHAGWNIIGIPIFGADGRPIDLVSGLVPASRLTIIDDWNAIGLRGTGSSTVMIEDVFIPDIRLISHHSILDDEYPENRSGVSALYNMPVLPTVMIKMTAPLIGVARGALETFIDLSAKRRIGMTFYQDQSKAAVTHLQVAEASAKIDAAETITRRSIDEMEKAATARRKLTREQKARMWRDAGFACRLAWEAVDRLADGSGGSFAREDNPISHAWRDVRTGMSHAGLTTATSYEIYGRIAFDLPSNSPLLPG